MTGSAQITRLFRIETDEGLEYVAERDARLFHVVGDIFETWELGPEMPFVLDDVRIVAPVVPSKIVAVGLNYRAHAAEQGKPLPAEPLIFIKPSTAVIGPGQPIVIPPGIGRVDHEAEVGIVIGRRACRVPASAALAHILGITAVNDVTARAIQRREGQYTRPKGFDTFAPVGPAIALGLDPDDVDVEGWVNGHRRQASSTRDLIFPAAQLVEFISSVMTLLPGDIISTGTPAGIGPLVPGDTVRVTVAGAGDLINPVVALQ